MQQTPVRWWHEIWNNWAHLTVRYEQKHWAEFAPSIPIHLEKLSWTRSNKLHPLQVPARCPRTILWIVILRASDHVRKLGANRWASLLFSLTSPLVVTSPSPKPLLLLPVLLATQSDGSCYLVMGSGIQAWQTASILHLIKQGLVPSFGSPARATVSRLYGGCSWKFESKIHGKNARWRKLRLRLGDKVTRQTTSRKRLCKRWQKRAPLASATEMYFACR